MITLTIVDNKKYDCTIRRTKKMFKYFRNKRVHVLYEYYNSMGDHWIREANILYDSFEILGSCEDWNILLKRKGKTVFEQELSRYWEFIGLGKLQYCNSGPYCYFTIKFRKGWL